MRVDGLRDALSDGGSIPPASILLRDAALTRPLRYAERVLQYK